MSLRHETLTSAVCALCNGKDGETHLPTNWGAVRAARQIQESHLNLNFRSCKYTFGQFVL